ncbi:MAG TPA: sialidase family protein, partial [Rubricoccaceae bacterium]
MHRLLYFAALVAALPPTASAQTFPAPGTGVYTWEPVTDRPLKAFAIAFGSDGTLYAASDTVYVYEPAPEGPPAGRWRRLGYPRLGINAVIALDPAGDTLLVGRGGVLSRSTDGGATWADVNGTLGGTGSGGPDHPGGFLVLPPGHPHAGRLLAGATPVYSDDRGATWTDAALTPALVNAGAHAFAALPSGRLLFSGFYGVAASDDAGRSYEATPFFDAYITDGLTALATPGS